MPDNVKKNIWLVGTGPMGIEYCKVLQSLDVPFEVIGRGTESAKKFESATGIIPKTGGMAEYLRNYNSIPEYAIVAVSIEQLASVAIQILEAGVKRVVVEKPGGLTAKEIESVAQIAKRKNAEVFVAYNRRFYSSVIKAERIIREDGGVTSFHFEFTEWSHVIEGLQKAPGVKENWFLGNSTHVIDLAFYLGGGMPQKISCYTSGGLKWFSKASIFAGAGISENGALFSYQANWKAPGRWGIELLTKKHRLILKPLEKLQVQHIGSVDTEFVDIEDELDIKFKPGLCCQTKAFLQSNYKSLLNINEQVKNAEYYKLIECGKKE